MSGCPPASGRGGIRVGLGGACDTLHSAGGSLRGAAARVGRSARLGWGGPAARTAGLGPFLTQRHGGDRGAQMAASRKRSEAMSKARKERITSIRLRGDGKRGKTVTQLVIILARAGQILDRLRRNKRRRPGLTGRHGTQPAIAQLPECRSARPSRCSSWPVGTTLGMVFQSLREALAAHCRYQELRSKGIPHATAIRQALDIPCVRQENLQGDTGNHLRSREQRK